MTPVPNTMRYLVYHRSCSSAIPVYPHSNYQAGWRVEQFNRCRLAFFVPLAVTVVLTAYSFYRYLVDFIISARNRYE